LLVVAFCNIAADPIPLRRPLRWDRLRTDEAERVIREWAQDATRVAFTRHAFERVAERNYGVLTTVTVLRVLREGQRHWRSARNERGHWQAIMARRMPGGRDACAVTVIVREDRSLVVRTVMWRD